MSLLPSPPLDASATQRGVVNTTIQTLAGNKTFTGSVGIGGAITPDSPLQVGIETDSLYGGGPYAAGGTLSAYAINTPANGINGAIGARTNWTTGAGPAYLTSSYGELGYSSTTGTSEHMAAVEGDTLINTSANLTGIVSGLAGFVQKKGSGVITHAAAIHAFTVTDVIGGGITNAYGILIGEQENAPNTPTNAYALFYDGVTKKVVIRANGRVGIGTISPSEMLDVVGNIKASGTVTGSNLSGTNTGDWTLNSIGSSPNANGASLVGGNGFTLQPASASFGGVVTTDTQTFAGAKTFSGAISASNLSGTNTGDITLAAVGSSPSANGASLSSQVLTLQPADSTHPGLITTGAQTFAGGKAGAVTSLTSSGASIAINLANNNNFSHTFTENTTLASPSNAVGGQSGIITFTQHASSPKTLAVNSFWKFPGGTPGALVTATNSAIDAMAYFIEPGGTYAICQMLNDIKT